MSPPQLQAEVIIGVIAIFRAHLRRDTPAEGERGRTGREAVPDSSGQPQPCRGHNGAFPPHQKWLICARGPGRTVQPSAAHSRIDRELDA